MALTSLLAQLRTQKVDASSGLGGKIRARRFFRSQQVLRNRGRIQTTNLLVLGEGLQNRPLFQIAKFKSGQFAMILAPTQEDGPGMCPKRALGGGGVIERYLELLRSKQSEEYTGQ